MIIIYHQNNKVTEIVTHQDKIIPYNPKESVAQVLVNVAAQFPESTIFWCHKLFKQNLNLADYKQYFHNNIKMLSYQPKSNYFSEEIGYVEQSAFIKINKEVTYPTWQMSSVVGVIHASILLQNIVKPRNDFDYFLNSLAKSAMPFGLLCYSEPKLLKGELLEIDYIASKKTLYKFVKEHYKIVWVFLLFFNELVFDKNFNLIPFINALFYKNRSNVKVELKSIELKTVTNEEETGSSIDVLIPTLGRKEHLYNVLVDLSNQTLKPTKVIIVEQNDTEGSVSELEYLEHDWPFKIDHTFIHQLGACNARNIGLDKVTSDWVFFADDDVRFENDLLEKSLDYVRQYGVHSITMSCLQKGEKEQNLIPFQWGGFGTNASIVKSKYLTNCSFKQEHEFGYGEDTDFGMQLKNKGCDVLYIPYIKMLHLKAPIGGFRTKFFPMWEDEPIKPKPSPTVMAYKLKHKTREQLMGYKTLLYIKYYKEQQIKNPIFYIKMMNNKWNKSVYWAKKMMYDEI